MNSELPDGKELEGIFNLPMIMAMALPYLMDAVWFISIISITANQEPLEENQAEDTEALGIL